MDKETRLAKARFAAELKLKKEMHKGDPGYTPVKGKDYFTPREITEMQQAVAALIRVPKDGKDGKDAVVDYEKILRYTYAKVAEHVSKIPKPKDGKPGKAGKDAKPVDIEAVVQQVILSLPKQKDKKFVIDRDSILKLIDERVKANPQQPVRIGASVASIRALTDVNLEGLSQDAQGNYILGGGTADNITGLISAGTDVTITGTGTALDPYVISSTASGGVSDGDKGDITVSASGATWTIDDGVVSYAKTDAGVQASLDLADSAQQPPAEGPFVNGDKTKLDGIAAGAEVNTVDSVNSQTGAVVLDADDIDDSATTNKFATAAEKTKLGHISVTQAVDLDQMETDIAALANGMVYKGDWDASSGSFPGAGAAQIGWFYYVSVGGTVDGIEFTAGDNIIAIVDNASTTTYAANWSKHDQTDAVQSVAGLTGSIAASALRSALNVEDGADVTDAVNIASSIDGATAKSTPVDADTVPLIDSAASNGLKKVTWANIKATLKTYFDTLYLGKSTPFIKAITIESPTSSEDITMFFTDDAITVTQMNAVLANGSSTPSVTWTVRHSTDRSAAGNEVVTSGTTTTSITSGSEVTSFNDATIPAGSWVWLETTAQSGTVPELNVTLEYTLD